MKTALGIIILLTVLYCVAGDGEFVTKEEFEELKQIVGSLKKLYMNDKTQNHQLRRQCNDLEGTLKYVLDQLKCTQSRLSKLEHEMESSGLHTKAKTTKVKEQNFSIENYESKQTGVEYINTHTIKDPNKQNVTVDHRNRATIMPKENNSVDSLFRRFIPVSSGSKRVAFSAWHILDNRDLGYHQTIVFKTVLINEGNCYHPSTGIFLPSIPGVYVFYFSIIVAPNVELRTNLVKDGTEISQTYAHSDSSHYSQAGNMAIVHLNAGESVWVRIFTQSPAAGYDIGNEENSFSGFLLYSDNN